MSNPSQRYEKLGLKDSLRRIYQYPLACKELSFILRGAYNHLPKNLQSLMFQDTLTAFHLLPEMQTRSGVTAAHILLQSAEASLPRQKKNSAVKEFKHAMVAYKRRCKARQEEKGSAQLPQDVLVHIFGFLDMQSLVSVGLVCWSWNLAATDNYLWRSQYATFFGSSDKIGGEVVKDKAETYLFEDMTSGTHFEWREAFKTAFKGGSSRKFTSSRGYCGHCKTVVWLDNTKCGNEFCKLNSESQQIKPVSYHQVVQFLLDDAFELMSSSDSDSDCDSDQGLIASLWAFPKLMSGSQVKPLIDPNRI